MNFHMRSHFKISRERIALFLPASLAPVHHLGRTQPQTTCSWISPLAHHWTSDLCRSIARVENPRFTPRARPKHARIHERVHVSQTRTSRTPRHAPIP